MGYYDPPEEYEFLGCVYCSAPEEYLIETDHFLYCSCCGFTQETADKFMRSPCCDLFKRSFEEYIEEPIFLTPEERKELDEASERAEIQRLKDAGLMTEDGELTSEYYAEADFWYDCYRERNRR